MRRWTELVRNNRVDLKVHFRYDQLARGLFQSVQN